MPNPDFPLAPWEVPPDSHVPLTAPADHVFEAVWRGRKTQMLARQAVGLCGETRYFVRAANSDEVGNWTTGHRETEHPDKGHLGRIIELVRFWPHCVSLHRCYYFDGATFGCPGRYSLHINPKGAELFFQDPTSTTHQGRYEMFRHDVIEHELYWKVEEFLAIRAANLGRWARKQMENPRSALGSSLRWIRLSKEEKQCLHYGFSSENLALFQRLMVHVLRTQSTLWQRQLKKYSFLEEQSYQWRIATQPCLLYDHSERLVDQKLVQEGDWMIHYSHSIPPRLILWREVLCQHFGFLPKPVGPSLRERLYMIEIEEIEVEVGRPTSHEIIESAAALHQWWRESGVPGDIALLMQRDEPHLHLVDMIAFK